LFLRPHDTQTSTTMARAQLSVKLSDSEQKSLTKLTEKFRCFTGEGKPSFRPLLRAIANGHLVVSMAGEKGGEG
ncbi:hypothetical protein ACI3PL_26975, partial [Lacticaseibacillus paracasei]